jgi:predicted metalloprotease with PDZ domain
MPTSPVKHVSGPPQPQKAEPQPRRACNRRRQSLTEKTSAFGLQTVLFGVCLLLSFATPSSVNAQTLNARFSVVGSARIKIDAQLPSATNTLSFRNTYGGVLGLGERVEKVEGVASNNERIPLSQLAPGEFRAAERVSRFTYDVNLAEPLQAAEMSHVSSLNSERGLLMLADLLPQSIKNSSSFTSAVINVDVPAGWTVASNLKNDGGQFSTDDPETAVFLIGPSLHEKRQRLDTTDLSLVRSGKWPFSDGDAMKITAQLLEEYSRVTRSELKSNAVLMLIPYPGESGPESWSAETRGNVVVLLLGMRASRKSVLSRLGIVLSHELFHLWVPNSLKLEGDYDWFFEGFTLYQALRTDLRFGLISFDDYLETIARVYDSYLASPDSNRLSLLEASERRWTTSASVVYEKGMLVAFIYDLLLRQLTDCQSSVDDVYAKLFRLPATRQRSANETIISVLTERAELKTFVRDYIERAGNIDLRAVMSAFGIQVQRGSSGTTLVVARELNETQRKLLGCIGYRR